MVGAWAERPRPASELYQRMLKLKVLGSVLYVAAHPDDENTRLIAYMANHEGFETGYLSLTRGSGGQNLIGSDLGDALGVIRTQELLAAREIDGGRQFFTRARDFGFSKSATETLNVWDREAVLSDMVWVLRSFQPDVVITRFSPEPGFTHGHHTASAQLAQEAFRAAGDVNRYPEQLERVKAWQPRRLLWNVSPWHFRQRGLPFEPGQDALSIQVSGYSPLLGRSYPELAAASRSMHKSQGFGSAASREEQLEYLKILDGDPGATLMEGVVTDWSRLPGGERVQELVEAACRSFQVAAPHLSVARLIEIDKTMASLPPSLWRDRKRAEVQELVSGCLGLRLRAECEQAEVRPGESIKVALKATLQAPVHVVWQGQVLPPNQELVVSQELNAGAELTHPYWLGAASESYRGLPQQPPTPAASFALEIEGQRFDFRVPLVRSEVDPVRGEVLTPVAVTPAVSVSLEPALVVIPRGQTGQVTVRARGQVEGAVARLQLPPGWRSEPSTRMIVDGEARFQLLPPPQSSVAQLGAIVEKEGRSFRHQTQVIEHDHIPRQLIQPPASSRLIHLELERYDQRLGYLDGAGDEVARALTSLGYSLERINPDKPGDLARFDTIILGVRAYNVLPGIEELTGPLFEFVHGGGTLITQYNTTRGLQSQRLAPFPLELSRLRVTDEKAQVKFLAPAHPVLNTPNRLSSKDFEGWVQERGLYFPEKWDPAYTAVLSCHDEGEEPLAGGLLVAPYGKGHFVYTGYSFFRQLPAGVPGAYRLFVNLISLGHQP